MYRGYQRAVAVALVVVASIHVERAVTVSLSVLVVAVVPDAISPDGSAETMQVAVRVETSDIFRAVGMVQSSAFTPPVANDALEPSAVAVVDALSKVGIAHEARVVKL